MKIDYSLNGSAFLVPYMLPVGVIPYRNESPGLREHSGVGVAMVACIYHWEMWSFLRIIWYLVKFWSLAVESGWLKINSRCQLFQLRSHHLFSISATMTVNEWSIYGIDLFCWLTIFWNQLPWQPIWPNFLKFRWKLTIRSMGAHF